MHWSLIFATSLLAGCVSIGGNLPSAESIQSQIKVVTGYPGCPDCVKIKTYESITLADVSDRVDHGEENLGWINAKVHLVSSNFTAGNVPRYLLLVELVTNGAFAQGVEFWLRDKISKTRIPLASNRPSANDGGNYQCFQSIGRGCSWTQYVSLPTELVQRAVNDGQDIPLAIGKEITVRTKKSPDGLNPGVSVSQVFRGVYITIAAQSINNFVVGARKIGAELPSSDLEAEQRQKEIAQAENNKSEIATRKRKELPFKQKIGTKVCQSTGRWISVGYVEKVENSKLQIRVSNIYLAGYPNVHPDRFKESIVWNSIEDWDLCLE